jgi:hypothetical protein
MFSRIIVSASGDEAHGGAYERETRPGSDDHRRLPGRPTVAFTTSTGGTAACALSLATLPQRVRG